jgi:hypothetical protein
MAQKARFLTQSHAEKIPLNQLPLAAGGTNGPLMNAGERTPPSQFENFPCATAFALSQASAL